MPRHSIIRYVPNNLNENRGPDMIYIVDLYENNVLVESRAVPNKSLHYVNSLSDNWDNGILQLEKE
jgi:hypothetical protein